MYIKIKRHHFAPIEVAHILMSDNFGEDAEQCKPSYLVGWNVTWFPQFGEQFGHIC